jgi:hypothetical protein
MSEVKVEIEGLNERKKEAVNKQLTEKWRF